MKERLLSAGIGLIILAFVMLFFNSILFNFVISIISLLAVYEILVATKYINNHILTIICLAFVSIIPFFGTGFMFSLFPLACFLFIMALFILLLFRHETVRLEQIGLSFFISIIVPCSMSTLIFIRDRSGGTIGLFYLFLALAGSWLTDTGAYFAGRAFGKRKLAPRISPNKTVEGVIGGLITGLVGFLLIGNIYSIICAYFNIIIEINYFYLLFIAPFCSLAGVFGDLSASIIKRQCSIKDFGYIMPGHGGILDRFDSVLFVAPLVYIFTQFLPIITML